VEAENNTVNCRSREGGSQQWRCQLCMHWGTCLPSTSNNFIFSSLWSKSDSQLSSIV